MRKRRKVAVVVLIVEEVDNREFVSVYQYVKRQGVNDR